MTLIEAHSHQTVEVVNVNWLSEQLQRNIQSDLTHLTNEGIIYATFNEERVKFTHDNNADTYENSTEEQKAVLTLIKVKQDQTVNGVNVTWLSDFVQRDDHNDLIRLMNEGLIYDKISQNWVKAT